MQIPLVKGKVFLFYSSWFSDLEFAFFVRGFGHALFDFYVEICEPLYTKKIKARCRL